MKSKHIKLVVLLDGGVMGIVEDFTLWRQSQNFSYSKASSLIKVDKGNLRQMERGERKIPLVVLGKMANILETKRKQ